MKKLSLVICMALMALSFAAFALDYSSDIRLISTDKNGKLKKADKVLMKNYVSGEKGRTEMMGGVTIMRSDKKLVWTLMDQMKMYMEYPIPEQDPSGAQVNTFAGYSAKNEKNMGAKMGNEAISGIACDKYRVEAKDKKGTVTSFYWISKDGIMMRFVSKGPQGQFNGWQIEYLKKGPLPASLFEVPAGYKKAGAPGKFQQ